MKKTLIALATLAAAGGAFAQSTVTLSGVLGFQSISTDFGGAQGVQNSFGVHDAALTATATEDLGGGLKATAAMSVGNFGGRLSAGGTPGSADGLTPPSNGTVKANDTSLTLAGGFGTIALRDYEAGNGIIGRGYAGAPVIGADGAYLHQFSVLPAGVNRFAYSYTSPSFGGVTVGVGATDANGILGSASGNTQYSVSVAYADGGLSAGADYNLDNERFRASASYDFGAAKVGFGTSVNQKATSAATITNTNSGVVSVVNIGDDVNNTWVVGLSVPMGALTLGATYSKQQVVNAAATEFGVSYALSKRTSASFAYKSHNAAAETITGASSQMRARLTHTF